jgi:hypothetical protein
MDKLISKFVPGLELNRHFFHRVIRPLMEEHFPDLKYSAGLVGEGSDVLGYDTPQSMDHGWGPHMRIFLQESDFNKKRDLDKMFRKKLPYEFMGFPTNFTKPNKNSYLVQEMEPKKSGTINHFIHFYTVKSFFEKFLGFDPRQRVSYADWLTFPQQALLEVTAGEIYFDQIGLGETVNKFKYFPDEVWMYIYAHQWGYIGDEEMYMGRSGEIGDELGSNVIATRMVNNIMKLCFLLEKKYFPYSKWLGTAFVRLQIANELTYPLFNVVTAKKWEEREEYMGQVYEIIAKKHNELKITKRMPTKATVSERPHKIIKARVFYDEISKNFSPFFKNLNYQIGSIDQFIAHARINQINRVHRELSKTIK